MTELLRVADVARILKVKEDAVRRRIHSKKLRALRDGDAGFRIRQEDLDAYIKSIEYRPAPSPMNTRAIASDRNLARARHLSVLARRGNR